MNIAIISTRVNVFDSLSQSLSVGGSNCIRFDDGLQLARAALRQGFDVVLLDAWAGLDAVRPAFDRCRRLPGQPVPVVLVGLSADGADLELAFELGVDDVVTAPIDDAELVARTRCAARRAHPALMRLDDQIVCGAHRLDRGTGTAFVDGEPIPLAGREFALAWLLFSRPGTLVTRREIACEVWLSSEDIVGRTLEQHVYKLRKKLRLHGAYGAQLSTHYALGYRLEVAPDCAPPPRAGSGQAADGAAPRHGAAAAFPGPSGPMAWLHG
ncbi:MAG: response regulator transcription factor [Burkholderiaceae bacterium]